jgi:hypothetical protein
MQRQRDAHMSRILLQRPGGDAPDFIGLGAVARDQNQLAVA